jgi:hypothetical protein
LFLTFSEFSVWSVQGSVIPVSRVPRLRSLHLLRLVPQIIQYLETSCLYVDAALRGQVFDPLEAAPEFPIGSVQRRPGLNACLPGEVDYREEEIPDLID